MKNKFLLSSLILIFFLRLNAQKIEVSYPLTTFNQNFTGNVLLYLSKDNPHPKNVFVGAEIFPTFRIKVENLSPNEKVVFDDDAISFPVQLSNLERGEYFVQAVFDRNMGGRTIGNSAGNIFSITKKTVGEQDNFYLHKAVHLLEDEITKLNGNMQFKYFSGDHFTVHFNEDYQKSGFEFLENCYEKWLNKQ